MNDYMRESLSYFGLFLRMLRVKKVIQPECFIYGSNKEQYCLYYEPKKAVSNKVIVWVHGGGWNAGNPRIFDFVGQRIAGEGYHMISVGYRLSPKYKYPCQVRDVCKAYNKAMDFLKEKGVDTSKVVVAGPSAGAHLTSILCYSKKVQQKYGVDISNVIGYVGWGGPYSFRIDQGKTIRMLLNQLFKKGYDRRNGEPVMLQSGNHIPMLLIQSKHDGLIEFGCAEDFEKKARKVGNKCEIYSVRDKKNTHSWYTAGAFMDTRNENQDIDKFFTWVEDL